MSEVMRWKLKGFLPGVEGMCKAVMRPEVVMASDYDAAQSELTTWKTKACEAAEREAALREELAKADPAGSFDKHMRYMQENIELKQRLAAAEQRNAELTQALERGKLWLELFRAWFGDYGVSQEDHAAIIRTLKGLPHPPSEFDKPTESGASE